MADEAKALEAQFKEMTDNIPLYIFDKGQQSDVSSKLADKQSQFEAMNKVDEQVLKLKKENITLADNLTKTTATVQKKWKRYQCIQNETDSNYDFCAVFKCRYSDYADTADQPNHE